MLKMGAVVWGVRDIPRAVRFWSEALHYKLREPAGEDWAVLIPIEGEGMQLSLSLVASPHARRHHIDLLADQMEQEVALPGGRGLRGPAGPGRQSLLRRCARGERGQLRMPSTGARPMKRRKSWMCSSQYSQVCAPGCSS